MPLPRLPPPTPHLILKSSHKGASEEEENKKEYKIEGYRRKRRL